MRIVLISTYELGRQPFGLASPAAWLRHAGAEVTALDLSRQRLDEAAVRDASLVAFYLPMHTATRLAMPVIERVREINPAVRLCAFGLYAPPTADLLSSHGVAATFGAEFEADLVTYALGEHGKPSQTDSRPADGARLTFLTPDRTGLPPLEQYATLQVDGGRRTAGYTEASRGCRHQCRHCPVVPIYGGQFRIVPVDTVMADIANQVAAGATHITFGDPDFFNGPAHARRVVDALHETWPALTYDATIKVEHLLGHADLLPRLRDTGCLFVTSAAESVDDAVLVRLDKGHCAADIARAVAVCDRAGLPLAPTFVPFTPWTTVEGYGGLLATIEQLGIVEAVAPIQLGIRLLVPERSRLLDLPDVRALVGPYDAVALAYPWRHRDPRVDDLQREVMALVGRRLNVSRAELFAEVRGLARDYTGGLPVGGLLDAATDRACPARVTRTKRPPVPYLNEPWYC
ncbi:MAG: CUAEP/CCAEP-tail radical SAM protein [Acidobacteria bacterium]|nr:CUAEP/CCAEP-tail radical SAM protein [Acidobacteriota bacterium]